MAPEECDISGPCHMGFSLFQSILGYGVPSLMGPWHVSMAGMSVCLSSCLTLSPLKGLAPAAMRRLHFQSHFTGGASQVWRSFVTWIHT